MQDPGFESGVSGFFAQDASSSVAQSSSSPIDGAHSLAVVLNGWGDNVWWTQAFTGTATQLYVSAHLRIDAASSSTLDFCAYVNYSDGTNDQQCDVIPAAAAGDKGIVSSTLLVNSSKTLSSISIRLTQVGSQELQFTLDDAVVDLSIVQGSVPTPTPTPGPTASPGPTPVPTATPLPTPVSTANPAGAHPRLLLDSTFLPQLQARAVASNPDWVNLKANCDQMVKENLVDIPSGDAYPDPAGSIGQGYQGDGYTGPLRELALCYQMLQQSDPVDAAKYGAMGVNVLMAIATPASSGGEDPSTDDGYGIRNYGMAMAIGYDWLYPLLTIPQQQQVITTLNAWIDWFDSSGFENGNDSNDAASGNYYQGYFIAKTFGAIATEGDNANSATYWSDVQNHMWGQMLYPVLVGGMFGGGWSEGWEYGALSVRNLVEALWGAKTGKGMNWINQVSIVSQEAAYMMQFAWPSQQHMDDQGTIHSIATQLYPSTSTLTTLASALNWMGDSYAPTAQSFAASVLSTLSSNGDDREDWAKFMYWNSALPQSSYTSSALSYLASGSGQVAMRSDWTKTATWAAFVSGPYVDSPNASEQLFNQGAVTMAQGDVPILINEAAWGEQEYNDNACENQAYADNMNDPVKRDIYNTFYVAMASNASGESAYMGQNVNGPFSFDGDPANTRMTLYEDGGTYVHSRGVNIEQMYFNSPMSQFTRDVVFVRPDALVIYDRTTMSAAYASNDQWNAFYFPAMPAQVSTTDTTQNRYDMTYNGVTGTLRSLLPLNAKASAQTISGCTRAFGLQIHAATPQASTDWLTTVVANNHGANQVRLSSSDGNVTGTMLGVLIQDTPRNQVVLFNNAHAANGTSSSVTYTVAQTAAADHVLIDMAASATGYSVQAVPGATGMQITVIQGGSLNVSATGVLAFSVGTDGTVTQP